jgi:hypothetical protein
VQHGVDLCETSEIFEFSNYGQQLVDFCYECRNDRIYRKAEDCRKPSEYGGYADNEWALIRQRALAKRPPSGVDLIKKERARQVDDEHWTAEHDDKEEERGGLVRAAMCYLDSSLEEHNTTYVDYFTWPWDKKYDKRDKHDRLRKLVIAGALVAAEIDRLQRKAANR